MRVPILATLVVLIAPGMARSDAPAGAILHLDFARTIPGLRLVGGAKVIEDVLSFDELDQAAELDDSGRLDRIEALTVGGWFYPMRAGEQAFFSRGSLGTAPGGERVFPPREDWVSFVLGTDGRGFLMGTIHGNGRMPFPHVTTTEVPVGSWCHLVVAKDERGYQEFYINGKLVHTDRDAEAAGVLRPYRDESRGEPLRLSMPLGGRIGEVWLVPRTLSAEEIRRSFEADRNRYRSALPVEAVGLRPMHSHPDPGFWERRGGPLSAETWPEHRGRIRLAVDAMLGAMPARVVPLEPRVESEEDCGTYLRRKVSIAVEPGERMPAYLLIPKGVQGRIPAVVCSYGTTAGSGKETTVGLSGAAPGSEPSRNRAFALDVVAAGYVALAPDFLRDGERLPPSGRPYDTADFYERHPNWSVHGKDAWDTMRAIDYLQTLEFIDPERIGMMGHSYGGHGTIFTAAIEPRIKVAVANGPVSDFRGHGLHWAVPPGAGASQSMPAMRPYVLDHALEIPVEFSEWTALIAPRPLLVGQAVGERRPREEENHAIVRQVYDTFGAGERVSYVWHPGDHDFPPEARAEAIAWFRRWL